MKRLVTLGITLALVMGLFCFTVNAEDIVIQGESDTVTATYGSNDITIALRARKLRVVNTGTAAAGYAGYTPVIVSVTIYNLGNQNCLVNNLKFRLTSGSAEYRIAGYENISPDLFISDTAYDATGYLSLKAANEYTYSGGFVVPANTNMTYVGIINVSANWITENQTWRTVDLSTATFYDNLTTTVGNYPCNAEPVDISGIESSLDDIYNSISDVEINTDSLTSLLSDLIDVNTYTGSISISIPNVNKYNFSINNNLPGYRRFLLAYTRNKPIIDYIDIELDPSNDQLITYYGYHIDVDYYLLTNNYYGETLKNDNYRTWISVTPYNMGTYVASELIKEEHSLFNSISYFNDNLELYCKYVGDNGRNYFIPPGVYNDKFTLRYYFNQDVQYSVISNQPVLTPNSTSYTVDNSYYFSNHELADLNARMQQLLDNYNSVNGIDDLSDAASDASDQAAAIHNQEASYYAQNQAAIEATGLSNYQFSGEQSNGIGAVSNDFTALWNALGSWNSVYIFSMTLTLALTILRHVPNRRKPKEKNSE